MEDRKRLTTMLKDFQAEQRDLLTQAEQRLQVIFCSAIVIQLYRLWKAIELVFLIKIGFFLSDIS